MCFFVLPNRESNLQPSNSLISDYRSRAYSRLHYALKRFQYCGFQGGVRPHPIKMAERIASTYQRAVSDLVKVQYVLDFKAHVVRKIIEEHVEASPVKRTILQPIITTSSTKQALKTFFIWWIKCSSPVSACHVSSGKSSSRTAFSMKSATSIDC
jgi:hypothetical protein